MQLELQYSIWSAAQCARRSGFSDLNFTILVHFQSYPSKNLALTCLSGGVQSIADGDYFSRLIEITKLTEKTSAEVIKHMKSIIAPSGIPQEIFTDYGSHIAAA